MSSREDDATAGTDEGGTVRCVIPWEIPSSALRVETRLKTPLRSRLMVTYVGGLGLDWELELRQTRETGVQLGIRFASTEIPNLGFTHGFFLCRTDGGKSRLTKALLSALGRPASSRPLVMNHAAVLTRPYIFPGDKVRLRVYVELPRAIYTPSAIVMALAEQERLETESYVEGTLGSQLWEQVSRLGKEESERPPAVDVVIRCSDGRLAWAHKAVLATLGPRMEKGLSTLGAGLWRLTGEESQLSSSAVWEVLHLVYLRRPSSTLYKAPLSEVLETARLLGAPRLLRLEVERLLLLLRKPDNFLKLWRLSQAYGLRVLANAIRAETHDKPLLVQDMRLVREQLRQRRQLHANTPSAAARPPAHLLPSSATDNTADSLLSPI